MSENQKLSLLRLAQLWVAENPTSGNTAYDIAGDLVEAAARGEFDIISSRDEPEDESAPQDQSDPPEYRSNLYAETGEPISSEDIARWLAGRGGGLHRRGRVGLIMQDTHLTLFGLDRWCSRAEFDVWAKTRGLDRPKFVEAEVRAIETDGGATSRPGPTIAAERECEQWMRQRVEEGPAPSNKASLWKDARARCGPQLSRRSFDRVWAKVVPTEWRKPGRKSTHRIDTPV